MRMLLKVSIPVDAGNRAIQDGSLPKTVDAFVAAHKPEASYFISECGLRTALFVFDLKDPTFIPSVAEPFFMGLGAQITLTPAMDLADLRSGVDRLMKQR
ncbi:MAG: hypothetical protein HUU15_05965 [Candidatus Brocadiae bacterium]|nr:hypothetical protein [Candidatus Brocadiia bacterium]